MAFPFTWDPTVGNPFFSQAGVVGTGTEHLPQHFFTLPSIPNVHDHTIATETATEGNIALTNTLLRCPHRGCQESFSKPELFAAHLQAHVGAVGQTFNCGFEGCGASFVDATAFMFHAQTHGGAKPYRCKHPNCNASFTKAARLKEHKAIHVGDDGRAKEKPFKCTHKNCNKVFSLQSSLHSHLLTHQTEKVFKCFFPNCGQTFMRQKHYQRHQLLHSSSGMGHGLRDGIAQPFLKCPQCELVFGSLEELDSHGAVHKMYKCNHPDCGLSFSQANGLAAHLRIHTGEKPYKCPYEGCAAAFSQSSNLTTHMRVHTGEKPYKCTVEGCGAAFARSDKLKEHVTTHAGRSRHKRSRPYRCTFKGCYLSFAQSTSLSAHLQAHQGEKPYRCSHKGCSAAFERFNLLQKHQWTHANTKPQPAVKQNDNTTTAEKDSTPLPQLGAAATVPTDQTSLRDRSNFGLYSTEQQAQDAMVAATTANYFQTQTGGTDALMQAASLPGDTNWRPYSAEYADMRGAAELPLLVQVNGYPGMGGVSTYISTSGTGTQGGVSGNPYGGFGLLDAIGRQVEGGLVDLSYAYTPGQVPPGDWNSRVGGMVGSYGVYGSTDMVGLAGGLDRPASPTEAEDTTNSQDAPQRRKSYPLTSRNPKPFKCPHVGCVMSFATTTALSTHMINHEEEKPFKCGHPGCDAAFSRAYFYQKHIKTHNIRKPYRCSHEGCRWAFVKSDELIMHVESAHSEKPFKCQHEGCHLSFAKEETLEMHTKTHTGELPYQCSHPGCWAAFSREDVLAVHLRTHTGEKPHKCKWPGCVEAFKFRVALTKHMESHRDNMNLSTIRERISAKGTNGKRTREHDGEREQSDSETEDRTTRQKMRTYTGGEEEEEANNSSGGEEESRGAQSGQSLVLGPGGNMTPPVAVHKPFKCRLSGCGMSFALKASLNAHYKSHVILASISTKTAAGGGATEYKCGSEGCREKFAQLSQLVLHETVHGSERVHVCTHKGCGGAFVLAQTRDYHAALHGEGRPYRCSFKGCGAAFKVLSELGTHMRLHTGPKTFQCPYKGCTASYNQSITLKAHITVHTGTTSYVCTHPGCDAAFTKSSHLKTHIQNVHDEEVRDTDAKYRCSEDGCRGRFNTLAQLRAHMERHVGNDGVGRLVVS